jgi:hypothetical protein
LNQFQVKKQTISPPAELKDFDFPSQKICSPIGGEKKKKKLVLFILF